MGLLARFCLIAGIAVGIAVGSIRTAQAAPAEQPVVTIAPFLQDIRLTQAEPTKKITVNLTNGGKDTQDYDLTVVDFGSLDDSGGIAFAGTTTATLLTKYSLAHWLKLDQHSVSIPAGQKAAVTATLTNDSGLQPGGHYAAIVATLKQAVGGLGTAAASGGQVSIKQQLTALVLVTKVGGERYDLKLDSLTQDGNWQHLPQTVTLHFENPGNVHVVPRGAVKLMATGVRQRVVAQGVINEDSAYILPGASRKLTVDLRSIGRAELWPAKYYLQVDYRYDGLATFASRRLEISFLNLPVLLAAGALLLGLVVLAVLVGRVIYKRRRKTR